MIRVVQATVQEEFYHIERLTEELTRFLSSEEAATPSVRIRVCASIVDDFYTCIERIFKTIADDIDESLPKGEDWHKKLLRQMSIELPKVRPPVIGKKLFGTLGDYLKFRHLERNIYGFQLQWDRMEHLVQSVPRTAKQLRQALDEFFAKLLAIEEALED